MIEVVVRNEEHDKASINKGDFAMSIVGYEKEDAHVSLYGKTNLFDFAKVAGVCLSTLFKNMAKDDKDPYASVIIAKNFFMENFYGTE